MKKKIVKGNFKRSICRRETTVDLVVNKIFHYFYIRVNF